MAIISDSHQWYPKERLLDNTYDSYGSESVKKVFLTCSDPVTPTGDTVIFHTPPTVRYRLLWPSPRASMIVVSFYFVKKGEKTTRKMSEYFHFMRDR